MLNKQFLLNADGSYPNGVNKQLIESLGLIAVLPSQPPLVIPVYHYVKEIDAININGNFVQQWEIVKYSDEYIAQLEAEREKLLIDVNSNQV